jgi:CHRD domain
MNVTTQTARSRTPKAYLRLGALLLPLCGNGAAAAEDYQVNLGPAARTNATRLIAVGRGAAKLSYDGHQLSIEGTFGGLVSPATDAHLCQGAGIGVVGTCGPALAVSPDTSGTVTGTITLTAEQRKALRAGQLYIQINSVKAPAPAGNLWGWILLAHETVGQDVPQEGNWFLPQYDMPESAEHGSTHPLNTDLSSRGEKP